MSQFLQLQGKNHIAISMYKKLEKTDIEDSLLSALISQVMSNGFTARPITRCSMQLNIGC